MKITIIIFITEVNILVEGNCYHQHSEISVALYDKDLSVT